MNTIEDQPAPVPQPDRIPVWGLVIADLRKMEADEFGEPEPGEDPEEIHARILVDMAERDRLGRQRYGTPLTTGNGRNHLVDAYQEALDFVVYLRAWLEENSVDATASTKRRLRTRDIRNLYKQQLDQLWKLRWLMGELGAEK